MSNFDNLVNNFLNEDLDENLRNLDLEARGRGRPPAIAKKYVPSEKAFEIGYTNDSVEGRILQFLEDKPATMEELIGFLRGNFDEYHAVSACKEKIRELTLNDVLDFAPDAIGGDDDKEIPALDSHEDDEISAPDLMKHIGGAYDEYRRSHDLCDY